MLIAAGFHGLRKGRATLLRHRQLCNDTVRSGTAASRASAAAHFMAPTTAAAASNMPRARARQAGGRTPETPYRLGATPRGSSLAGGLPLRMEAVPDTGRRRRWHNRRTVSASLARLLPLFERERRAGRACALGVLVHTAGSTYQKPGALILIAANGDYAGLLSGGCLETDLREHAARVIVSGEAHTLEYEMGTEEDLLWGLGLGCEGTMRILLLRVGPQNHWQPLDFLAAAHREHTHAAVGIVCESSRADVRLRRPRPPRLRVPPRHPRRCARRRCRRHLPPVLAAGGRRRARRGLLYTLPAAPVLLAAHPGAGGRTGRRAAG